MARPKEFDPDIAVEQAMNVFWAKGYGGASASDLVEAMGIARQSMYNTFGDKHQLYVEALHRYHAEFGARLMRALHGDRSPKQAITAVLLAFADESAEERARGCMGVRAALEFTSDDAEIASLIKSSTLLCESAFEMVIAEGKQLKEFPETLDSRAASRFVLSTLRGLRVSASAGATTQALREIAWMAIKALT